jgi:Predicted membrane protein (DUF2232)
VVLVLCKNWTMKAVVGNLEVLSLAILSGILTLLPVFVPVGGGLLTALAPLPLVVLAVKYPWRYVVGLLSLEGGLLLLGDQPQLLFFLVQCGLVALATAGAIRRGWSISPAIVGGLVVPLGIGALLLVVYSTLVQPLPHDLLTRYSDQAVSLSQKYVQALEQMQEGEDEQLAALVEALPQLMLAVLPSLVVISHLFINVLNYLLVRRYCQRSQPPLRLDPDDLLCWHASDYLVWVFLASGAAVLIPIDAVSTIGLNVLLVTLAIYLLQGMAITLFWGRRLSFPLGVQWLVGAVVFLIAGLFCVAVCTAVGLFDLWVDFRRQRRHSLLP